VNEPVLVWLMKCGRASHGRGIIRVEPGAPGCARLGLFWVTRLWVRGRTKRSAGRSQRCMQCSSYSSELGWAPVTAAVIIREQFRLAGDRRCPRYIQSCHRACPLTLSLCSEICLRSSKRRLRLFDAVGGAKFVQ